MPEPTEPREVLLHIRHLTRQDLHRLLDFVMTPGEQQDRGTKTTGESAAGK